jgi:hypothetical protein
MTGLANNVATIMIFQFGNSSNPPDKAAANLKAKKQ